jgi:hypothetical protein
MSAEQPPGGRTSVLARLRQPIGAARTRPVHAAGLGGIPQVSLLPPEIRDAGALAHHRRRLLVAVAVAVLVAIAGAAITSAVAAGAQARLATANAETTALSAQVAKFSDIRALQARIALGDAAVKVGGSTMIDWSQRIRDIESEMPSEYTVTGITATGATPLDDYAQGTTSLEPRRAATVILTIATSTVGGEFAHWLTQLRQVPAYADATATTSSTDDGATITLTVHLTAAAITAVEGTDRP